MTNEQNLAQLSKRVDSLFYREKKVLSVIDREKGKKESWWDKESVLDDVIKSSSKNAILSLLYKETFANKKNIEELSYLGDKQPLYWQKDWCNLSEYLQPKVIHISRSPAAVLNSYRRRAANTKKGTDYWKQSDDIYDVLTQWKQSLLVCSQMTGKYDCLHITYEDFLQETSSVLQKVSSFLAVDNMFDASLVDRAPDDFSYLTVDDEKIISELLGGDSWENIDVNDVHRIQCLKINKARLGGLVKVRLFFEKHFK